MYKIAKDCNCTKNISHKNVKKNIERFRRPKHNFFSEKSKTVKIFFLRFSLEHPISEYAEIVKWHNRKPDHSGHHCVYHPRCRITTWRLLIMEITSFIRLLPCTLSHFSSLVKLLNNAYGWFLFNSLAELLPKVLDGVQSLATRLAMED